jgi:hypothetical protein
VLGLAWADRRVAVANARHRGAHARAGAATVDADATTVDLLPAPFPPSWAGQAIEAFGVPVGGDPSVTLGVAVRWHGERPAVLWEVAAPAMALTSSGLDPAWSSEAGRGEALLRFRPAQL